VVDCLRPLVVPVSAASPRPPAPEGRKATLPSKPFGTSITTERGAALGTAHVASETKRDAAARRDETAVDPNSVSAIEPSGVVPPLAAACQKKFAS
jgi:hypothetical protein